MQKGLGQNHFFKWQPKNQKNRPAKITKTRPTNTSKSWTTARRKTWTTKWTKTWTGKTHCRTATSLKRKNFDHAKKIGPPKDTKHKQKIEGCALARDLRAPTFNKRNDPQNTRLRAPNLRKNHTPKRNAGGCGNEQGGPTNGNGPKELEEQAQARHRRARQLLAGR